MARGYTVHLYGTVHPNKKKKRLEMMTRNCVIIKITKFYSVLYFNRLKIWLKTGHTVTNLNWLYYIKQRSLLYLLKGKKKSNPKTIIKASYSKLLNTLELGFPPTPFKCDTLKAAATDKL